MPTFSNYPNLLYNAVPLLEGHSEPCYISCFSDTEMQPCLHHKRQRPLRVQPWRCSRSRESCGGKHHPLRRVDCGLLQSREKLLSTTLHICVSWYSLGAASNQRPSPVLSKRGMWMLTLFCLCFPCCRGWAGGGECLCDSPQPLGLEVRSAFRLCSSTCPRKVHS